MSDQVPSPIFSLACSAPLAGAEAGPDGEPTPTLIFHGRGDGSIAAMDFGASAVYPLPELQDAHLGAVTALSLYSNPGDALVHLLSAGRAKWARTWRVSVGREPSAAKIGEIQVLPSDLI